MPLSIRLEASLSLANVDRYLCGNILVDVQHLAIVECVDPPTSVRAASPVVV